MKILLLTHFFPPHHFGGIETYTYDLARCLQKKGCEVNVLCAGDWERGVRNFNGYIDSSYAGIHVRRLNMNWKKANDPFLYLYDNSELESPIRDYLEKIRPDIVHVTSCYTLSSSPLKIAKNLGFPIVLHLCDFWFLCPRVNLVRGNSELCDGRTTAWECTKCMLHDAKVYRYLRLLFPEDLLSSIMLWLVKHPAVTRRRGLRGMAGDMNARKICLRQVLTLADRIIVPSSFVKYVFSLNGTSEKLLVLPQGIDPEPFSRLPVKTQSSMVRFGYIGQLAPLKGIHILLQAYQQIASNGRSHLFIYGDLDASPHFAQNLSRLAEGRGDISFEGTFERAEIGKVLSGLDVLVMPSMYHETYGLVIQEAWAAGIPVIATAHGAMKEFVQHEVNGLLFERGNVQDLARQLRRVVDDPGTLNRLKLGVAPIHTIEDEVKKIIPIYYELRSHSDLRVV